MSDDYTKLEKLNDLKQKGIITEEEFNAKKQEILGNKNNQPEPQKTTYDSFNSHYQKMFQRYDAVIKEVKATGKNPGLSKLWGWNWGAFWFGPFWLLYKKRNVDFIIYTVLVIIGFASGGVLLPFSGIYWFTFALWGDFYEYYHLKMGKVVSWKTPNSMVKELTSIIDQ